MARVSFDVIDIDIIDIWWIDEFKGTVHIEQEYAEVAKEETYASMPPTCLTSSNSPVSLSWK